MSENWIYKAACLIYGVSFVLLGVAFLVLVGRAIGPNLIMILAAIPIAIGLFAFLGNVWAMIIGTVLVVVFPFAPAFEPTSETLSSAPWPILIVVDAILVGITILAVACSPHPDAQ